MKNAPDFFAKITHTMIRSAIENYGKLEGMRRAFETAIHSQEKNKEMIEKLNERMERAREVRQQTFRDLSIVKKAVERMSANGIRVRIAHSKQEALDMILDEIGGEKLVVKSKSNVSKEIELTGFLESKGIVCIETDAGDRIIQVAKERTVHPTGPAAHLTRYDVALILSKHLRQKIEPTPEKLTEAIRNEITCFISQASIGITGANFIAAEEGSIILVHNEGNITACARRPKKHIIISSIEKIVPNLDEAMNLAKIQILYGTGSLNSSFIDVVSAPSRTADIEKIMFYGMHGPKEVVLILLDNGRSLIENKEVLYCINCGSCLLKCPVYDILGPDFGSHAYLGGRGVCFAAELDGYEHAIGGGLTFCTECGLCKEMCPLRIDIPNLIREARSKTMKQVLSALRAQEESIKNVAASGNPWNEPSGSRPQWAHGLDLPTSGEILFFAGCFNSLRAPEISRSSVEILQSVGINVAYMGSNEMCCGSPFYKIGAKDIFLSLVQRNIQKIKEAGVRKIITPCPGCFNTLSIYSHYDSSFDIEIEHITQTIASLIDDGRISFDRSHVQVTYHDPCDLGRHRGIFEPPRLILESIPGLVLSEMEFTKDRAICCGAGAGVKKSHPELATFIAGKRLEQAKKTGASHLVTACSFCERNFQDAIRITDSGMQVVNIVNLARALAQGS
ncbi:MAG: LUD domain-containing protein [Methanomassiliicoccales archaeon]